MQHCLGPNIEKGCHPAALSCLLGWRSVDGIWRGERLPDKKDKEAYGKASRVISSLSAEHGLTG